jgi:hypothetical protein
VRVLAAAAVARLISEGRSRHESAPAYEQADAGGRDGAKDGHRAASGGRRENEFEQGHRVS